MDLLFKVLSFIPELSLLDTILVAVLGIVSIILIVAAVVALAKDKPILSVIMGLLGGLTLGGSVLYSMKSNDTKKEEKEKIKQLKEKEKELIEEMKELDTSVQINYNTYQKLKKEKENIHKELEETLEEIKKIEPKKIENSDDVLDAFDTASEYSKKKKE
jgi:ABC-type transport system involved in cytochrome bd biosynthesis fused ATPase/permease subunit